MVTTIAFYVMALVTVILQFTMYFKRAEFLNALKGQEGRMTNSRGLRIQDLGTMMQIILPVRLERVREAKLDGLRKSAARFSTYWIVSLLTTLTLPILIYNLLEWWQN